MRNEVKRGCRLKGGKIEGEKVGLRRLEAGPSAVGGWRLEARKLEANKSPSVAGSRSKIRRFLEE
jgi:hypothetical protein